MSLSLRTSKYKPEVVAHGFTSLNIKHRISIVDNNDTFEVSFTDNRGQEYEMTLYAASSDTDIQVDDATAARINRPDVDLLDAKKFLATRDAYAAESAVSEINERVVIDF